ncbi:DUF3618 domain-containing protein [Microvirga alba]|uniref:DUF3618 domain-containing protein n=1 Tax=Microvirga alba TaxID=2791025 RepID=A0A931FQC5_9HYPH|nr:DUF3618 domain-containing protein [Microvirga alba]MBF9234472.1 DUF3618 domain-containing protein [Microvirga alba]
MTRSLDDLEREIEETRSKLDLTIDRLQGKMTVSGIVDDMLGAARTGRYAPLFDNMMTAIRRHPVPVMLVAAGIGLLLHRARHAPAGVSRSPRLMDQEDVAAEPEDTRLYGSGASPLQPPQDMFERRRVTNSRI